MKVLDKFPDKPRRAKKVRTPDTISPEELQNGCLAFQQRERRDAMYKTATFLVKYFWGKPTEVAEGLGSCCASGTTPSTALAHLTTTFLRSASPRTRLSSTASGTATSSRTLWATTARSGRSFRSSSTHFGFAKGSARGEVHLSALRRHSTCSLLASSHSGMRRSLGRMTATTTAIRQGSTWPSS